MAEQVTPLTSSPLSQESRENIVRNTTVSGQTIRGSNLVSGITRSENEVKNLQVLQQNQSSLSEVQSGILGIKQDVNALNSGLITIATLLQNDAANEERILRSQQESERRLAEEQVRLGKESDIEKKIERAIVAPVEKIAPKVQNLFGNVLASLGYLFGGWLTNQVIDYIKEEGKGNNERLEEIKRNIIKNLVIAGGTLIAVRLGFNVLRRSLFGITRSVASLIGRTVATPFNVVRNMFTGGGGKPGGGKPSGGGGGGLRGIASGAGRALRNVAAPLAVGSIATGLDIASGEDPGRAIAGATTGMIGSAAAFAAGSLLPIPGSGIVSSAIAYSPSADFGKGIYDKFFGKPQASKLNKNQQPSTKPDNKGDNKPVQPFVPPNNVESVAEKKTDSLKPSPQQEMVLEPKIDIPNYSSNFNLSADTTFQTNNLSAEKKPDAEVKQNEAMFPKKNLSLDVKSTFTPGNTDNFLENYNKLESSETITGQSPSIEPSQIQSVPSQLPNVGELPEPKPNIIYASSANKQQGTQMNQIPPSGPLTDVPLIRSSNPDNFYTIYSYSCYNVVI